MTIGGLRHTGILKSHRHLLRRTHWLIFMYGLARKILEKFHLLTQVPRGGRRLIPLLYTSHKCTIRNLASLSDTWSKSDVPTDIRKNFEVPGGLGTTNAKLVYCITIVWVDPIKLIGSRQVRVPARCEWRLQISFSYHAITTGGLMNRYAAPTYHWILEKNAMSSRKYYKSDLKPPGT